METLITASGKSYECKYFVIISNPDRLYIRFSGIPIGEIATGFSDPAETVALTYEGKNTEGYTRLLSIIPEEDMIRVTLTRG